jgi:hypothetical protein
VEVLEWRDVVCGNTGKERQALVLHGVKIKLVEAHCESQVWCHGVI